MKKLQIVIGLIASAALIHQAQAASPFVGSYRGGSVDSVSQLALLKNRTFCFGLMAGSLNLRAGGTWKVVAGSNGKTIEVQEQRKSAVIFPVWQNHSGKQKNAATHKFITLYATSLSHAEGVVFGFSKKDLRPVFAPSQSRFQQTYTLPRPATARSLFVGLPSKNAKQYHMVQYRIDNITTQEIRLGFDRNAARELIRFKASLEDGKLVMQDPFGGSTMQKHSKPLSAKTLARLQARCVAPALKKLPTRKGYLSPKRRFTVPASSIQKTSWFDANTNPNPSN